MEPDGYAVLLDDPNVEGTPGGCGYWYVGAYRTEAVAKNVAERGKQGARVVPMWFAPPEAALTSKEGERLSRLRHRRDVLIVRITGGEKKKYIEERAELSAIEWAHNKICDLCGATGLKMLPFNDTPRPQPHLSQEKKS